MKLKNSIDKNLFSVFLLIIVFVNFMPVIISNIISKNSNSANTAFVIITFGIECIMLVLYYYKKVNLNKELKINMFILNVVSLILFIIQIKNYFIGNYKIMDFANIMCQFINTLLLFIFVLDLKTDESKINIFMKGIIIFGVLASINNLILYWKEILQVFGIIKPYKFAQIKSFFANRNQFAFILYISLISNIFILIKENKKIYKIIFGILFANLIFTMSRTGIAIGVLLVAIYCFCVSNMNQNKKIKICIALAISGIAGVIVIWILFPNFINKFLRIEDITKFAGRTEIWKKGLELTFENPINFLFGLGRFKGVEKLKIKNKIFTQFHNIYIDALVTGGILELIFIVYIYYTVIRKIFKSNMDLKHKKLYLSMYITYFIYICFESFGRFSIGASDTLCLIFFITIPLLHSNSIKENTEENEKEK